MKKFQELMKKTLEENRERIDDLRSVRDQIKATDKMLQDWKKLQGRGNQSETCANFYGLGGNKETSMANFQMLMDEHFYSNPTFEVTTKHRLGWIFHTIRSTRTEGEYSLDLGMEFLHGCKRKVEQLLLAEPKLYEEVVTYVCPGL